MDEAFLPLHRLVHDLTPIAAELVDDEAGVRTYLTAVDIDAPLEFDVTVTGGGGVVIGASPPLYSVRTSFLPSFHAIRFRVEAEERDGG